MTHNYLIIIPAANRKLHFGKQMVTLIYCTYLPILYTKQLLTYGVFLIGHCSNKQSQSSDIGNGRYEKAIDIFITHVTPAHACLHRGSS